MNPSLRFLFLLYHYPPFPGIAPKRNYQISSEISNKAAFSLIFTASRSHRADEVAHPVSVEKIPAYDYRYFIRKKNNGGSVSGRYKKSKWFQRSVKLMNTFPFNIIIGEGGLIYFINIIIRGHRAIRKHKITHLYSSYRPFADHYAAYTLKKLNPHIYWIADFRDFIIDPHYNHMYFEKANHLYFKNIFKKADLLTTVSEGLATHLREYNSKVITLKNGLRYIPDQVSLMQCRYFGIAYTGSMYLDQRNAGPLFMAVKELMAEDKIVAEDIQITYAGKDGSDWKEMAAQYGMEAMLNNKGMVSSGEAMVIQQNSCINLLLTSSSDQFQGVLTGKLIEYFEAGGPILAIVTHQMDPELESILHELQIGKSFSDRSFDLAGIKEFIYDEYLHWKRTGTNRKPVNLGILKRKYAVEETLRPLLEFILPLNPLKGT